MCACFLSTIKKKKKRPRAWPRETRNDYNLKEIRVPVSGTEIIAAWAF